MQSRHLARGVAVAALTLAAAPAALAQSTGSTTVQEYVVTATKTIAVDGLVTAQEAPKTRAVVTQEYLQTQAPGETVFQSINLVPGYNFTNNDPFGSAGGNIRLRGFDGSRVSELVDGVPLNDTGNYAVYTNQMLDPEVIAQVNVNAGSTDADSPTASAVGGLINIQSVTPTTNFNVLGVGSVGSDSYGRGAIMINTGELGPFGTKAWVEGSYQTYDKFKGPGSLEKKQVNGKIYQDLHHEGDFIAIAAHYNENRNDSLYGLNQRTFNSKTGVVTPGEAWNTDYNPTYLKPTCTGGVCTDPSANSNYYGLKLNPSNTGNIRGQSRFTLLPNLHFTFDPSFQYVLANGGGNGTISETDPRLIGNAPVTSTTCIATAGSGKGKPGVDLNHNGTCNDTVRVYEPSNTNTHRYTINSSLIWDITPNNLLRFAYALDFGHHRQTGEYSFLDANGNPDNVFGGKDGYGPKVVGLDPYFLHGRDRFSVAQLNQYSLEYVGKFFDNKLRLDLGVRDPHFSRDLNQFCYTSAINGSSVYCTDNVAAADANLNPKNLAGKNPIAPFHASVQYTKVLPNVGLTWHFDPANSVYFSYAKELSAPRTDDLYTVGTGATGAVNIDNVQPETSTTYELGYRYQTARIIGSLALWDTTFNNRIVSTYDQVTGVSDDRNVGKVDLYGAEGQLGVHLDQHWTLYGNLSYTHSELQDNLLYGYDATNKPIWEPLKGKQLVETPRWMAGSRIQYDADDWSLAVQSKWVGKRFITDVNDASVGSYYTADVDARYKLDRFGAKGSYVQLNVVNLGENKYYGSLGTKATADQAQPYYANAPYAYQGAPRTVWLTVHALFQ
jgi:iron complex outermembrane receptor protein